MIFEIKSIDTVINSQNRKSQKTSGPHLKRFPRNRNVATECDRASLVSQPPHSPG